MASLYTALGEKAQALAWLEGGYEQRDAWLVELKAWPWFDPLRDEPRFQALLRRMNFPE
jgi:serine/threonine-protein kinase